MGEKIKVEELGCFEQVAKVIGVERAKVELFKAISRTIDINNWGFDADKLDNAFYWSDTPQGPDFWNEINEGRNPYEN